LIATVLRISLIWLLVLVSQMIAVMANADTIGADDLENVLSDFDISPEAENSEDDTEEDIDEYLSGFDRPEELANDSTRANATAEKRRWRFTGDISVRSTYNYAHDKPAPGATDFRGLSQLKVQFRPELWLDIAPGWDAKISGSTYYDFVYRMNGRRDYTNEVLNDYESDSEFRETFIRGQITSRLDIKVGRQIVVWGKSDNFRVVDIINPLDLREPGLVDIEDLRLPSSMTRVDYYWGNWSLSGLAIHEIRFDKLPPYGSDFYPSPVKLPPKDTPDNGGSNTEFALSLSGIMQGWDLSLHLARLFSDSSHIELKPQGASLQYSRLTMAGAATNVATGDWLWKAEAAYFDGLEFFSVPDKEFERIDLMAGIEYNGFDNTTLSVESVVRHIHDFDQRLKNDPVPAERNRVQTAFRYNTDFLHDRLNVLLLDMRHGQTLSDGGFTRLQFKYELREALFTTLGVVSYHRGDTVPYSEIADNDRLFVDIEYSF
jgi:hypothetical protein